MSTIHLWDNSSHYISGDYAPSSRCLELPLSKGKPKQDVIESLRALSSSTIGNLMGDEENAVLMWPNSFSNCNEELKDQYIFRIAEPNGKSIDSVTTGNVVGFIGVGNTDVRIHSRFSPKSHKNDHFLYHMLDKVLAINISPWLTSASNQDPVFDFLLLLFPRLLRDALSQGVYKKYVYQEYNDANVRGVIDINRHISRNIPANGRIAYRTREFSYDNPVTQLIRHTIEFIRRKPFGQIVLHADAETEVCVQQIVYATPTFVARQRQLVINENLRPVTHPYYTKYAALQMLCLRLLRHEKLSYGQANANKIQGLLIDAAWLWEEYVSKVLSEGGSDLKHYTRDEGFNLLRTSGGHEFQQIIPDYYDAERMIVADAKYSRLHRYDHLDADRASAIYYKTIMYMYRFGADKGFLFHPIDADDVKSIKENPSFSHLVVKEDKGIVSCRYDIIDRAGCYLHEVGMIIPSAVDSTAFKNSMIAVEQEFVQEVNNHMSMHTCRHK